MLEKLLITENLMYYLFDRQCEEGYKYCVGID